MRRLGFTMIELVFIIVILGILSAVAVPKMMMSRDDACYAKLRANLSEAQSDISRTYTRGFMKGSSIKDDELKKILNDTLVANTSSGCAFAVGNVANGVADITMTVGKKSMKLKTERDAITKSPSIVCSDTSNDMCKKLLGKK